MHRPPWWLGGALGPRSTYAAHAQTVYPSLFGNRPVIEYRRERWETTPHGKPDGDFMDVDRLAATLNRTDAPVLVVFHGLEGNSQAPYALNLMYEARSRGWRGIVPHFRSCSGEINRLPRAYHSGDATEIDWILRRVKAESPNAPLYVAAISLGGNATLKWLGEQNSAACSVATAVAGISAPLDLMAAGEALEQGFCRVYTKNFLVTMKRKAFDKLRVHPGIFRAEVARAGRPARCLLSGSAL